jgi:hypothetical protein
MHGRAPGTVASTVAPAAVVPATAATPLKPAHEVTFMTTALALVAAGLGVTVCLSYAAPLVRLHQLGMRTLEAPVLTRRFFVYTRANRSPSPAAESFLAFLLNFVHNEVGNDGQGAEPQPSRSPGSSAGATATASNNTTVNTTAADTATATGTATSTAASPAKRRPPRRRASEPGL